MMWMIILFCHVTLWMPSVESCTLLRFTNIYELLMSFIFWGKKKGLADYIIKKKMRVMSWNHFLASHTY